MKRWTAKREQALVLHILRGETTAVEAARQHGLTVSEIEAWQENVMVAMTRRWARRSTSRSGGLQTGVHYTTT